MMPPRDGLADLANILGVERIEYDRQATVESEPVALKPGRHGGMVVFYAPVMNWWIDGKRYRGAVPVTLKKAMDRIPRACEASWVEDHEVMERSFAQMVRLSKERAP